MIHFSVLDYSLQDDGTKEHWDIPMYADHWHFPQFHKTLIPYCISSNCEEVHMYLNDKCIHVPKPKEVKNRIITGFIPWIKGKVTVIGLRDGLEVCRHETVTPEPATQLKFDVAHQTIKVKDDYELMLTVRATDFDGNPYFRESSLVRFSIEGGEILAVDNGYLMSNEPTIHMFHGCASVMIRINKREKRVKVVATSEGMFGGESVITVEA